MSFNNPNPYILSLVGRYGRKTYSRFSTDRGKTKTRTQKRAAEIDQKLDRHASADYSDDDYENYYEPLQHVQEEASAHSSDDGYSRYERHAIPDPTSEAGKLAEQRAHDRGTCSLNEPRFGRYHYTSEAGSAHSSDESRFKFERFPHIGSVPERLLLVNSDQRFCDDRCQCENDCDPYQCASGACKCSALAPHCDRYRCASGACHKCGTVPRHDSCVESDMHTTGNRWAHPCTRTNFSDAEV